DRGVLDRRLLELLEGTTHCIRAFRAWPRRGFRSAMKVQVETNAEIDMETMADATGQNPISMRALLEAGVHFGHNTGRWNPKMKQYIFGARNGIHIIDLQHTVKLFRQAFQAIVDTTSRGDTVLFVGTKKQAQDVIVEEAGRSGQLYVTQRWLGG